MPPPQTRLQPAQAILDQYIQRGDLLPESFLHYRAHDGAIVIENIVVPRSRHRTGIGHRFLTDLKAAGLSVDICLPRIRSLPFWEAMFAQGLIPHSPREYTAWENA